MPAIQAYLKRVQTPAGMAIYEWVSDDGDGRVLVRVELDWDAFHDLGRPNSITITITGKETHTHSAK